MTDITSLLSAISRAESSGRTDEDQAKLDQNTRHTTEIFNLMSRQLEANNDVNVTLQCTMIAVALALHATNVPHVIALIAAGALHDSLILYINDAYTKET